MGSRPRMTARLSHPCGIPQGRRGHRTSLRSVNHKANRLGKAQRAVPGVMIVRPHDPDPEEPGTSGGD